MSEKKSNFNSLAKTSSVLSSIYKVIFKHTYVRLKKYLFRDDPKLSHPKIITTSELSEIVCKIIAIKLVLYKMTRRMFTKEFNVSKKKTFR